MARIRDRFFLSPTDPRFKSGAFTLDLHTMTLTVCMLKLDVDYHSISCKLKHVKTKALSYNYKYKLKQLKSKTGKHLYAMSGHITIKVDSDTFTGYWKSAMNGHRIARITYDIRIHRRSDPDVEIHKYGNIAIGIRRVGVGLMIPARLIHVSIPNWAYSVTSY